MARVSITEEVQRFLSGKIEAGDIVIDATLGNGHDALFMASLIGDTGHLFGFDIQPEAVAATFKRLADFQLSGRATLMIKSHAEMAASIPRRFHGRIRCVMFNLGYLPGADKSLTTQSDTTITALMQAGDLLSTDGCISILAYTGHPGGLDECRAVKAWTTQLSSDCFRVSVRNLLPEHRSPPEWILIEKL